MNLQGKDRADGVSARSMPPYRRSHTIEMTLGAGSITASFTSRPPSTMTKLLTIAKGTPGT